MTSAPDRHAKTLVRRRGTLIAGFGSFSCAPGLAWPETAASPQHLASYPMLCKTGTKRARRTKPAQGRLCQFEL